MSRRTALIPERNGSKATFDLWFNAELPALGYSTFFVTPTTHKSASSQEITHKPAADIVISNTVSSFINKWKRFSLSRTLMYGSYTVCGMQYVQLY